MKLLEYWINWWMEKWLLSWDEYHSNFLTFQNSYKIT